MMGVNIRNDVMCRHVFGSLKLGSHLVHFDVPSFLYFIGHRHGLNLKWHFTRLWNYRYCCTLFG